MCMGIKKQKSCFTCVKLASVLKSHVRNCHKVRGRLGILAYLQSTERKNTPKKTKKPKVLRSKTLVEEALEEANINLTDELRNEPPAEPKFDLVSMSPVQTEDAEEASDDVTYTYKSQPNESISIEIVKKKATATNPRPASPELLLPQLRRARMGNRKLL